MDPKNPSSGRGSFQRPPLHNCLILVNKRASFSFKLFKKNTKSNYIIIRKLLQSLNLLNKKTFNLKKINEKFRGNLAYYTLLNNKETINFKQIIKPVIFVPEKNKKNLEILKSILKLQIEIQKTSEQKLEIVKEFYGKLQKEFEINNIRNTFDQKDAKEWKLLARNLSITDSEFLKRNSKQCNNYSNRRGSAKATFETPESLLKTFAEVVGKCRPGSKPQAITRNDLSDTQSCRTFAIPEEPEDTQDHKEVIIKVDELVGHVEGKRQNKPNQEFELVDRNEVDDDLIRQLINKTNLIVNSEKIVFNQKSEYSSPENESFESQHFPGKQFLTQNNSRKMWGLLKTH